VEKRGKRRGKYQGNFGGGKERAEFEWEMNAIPPLGLRGAEGLIGQKGKGVLETVRKLRVAARNAKDNKLEVRKGIPRKRN